MQELSIRWPQFVVVFFILGMFIHHAIKSHQRDEDGIILFFYSFALFILGVYVLCKGGFFTAH